MDSLSLRKVSKIFDEMAEEYDDISDLWYSWLFSRLHFLIAKNVINQFHPKDVLDVGCGTGFQSFLHAAAGARVIGIDISTELINKAEQKSKNFNPATPIQLFKENYEFVKSYNNFIFSILKKSAPIEYTEPQFSVADAQNLPFTNGRFDHVNCCGSVLSFIPDHVSAINEMYRVLKPGGTLFLEVESRWNMDIIWPFIDLIIRGKLGYDMDLKESLRTLLIKPSDYATINYPFGDSSKPIMMEIRLFTALQLKKELINAGFLIKNLWTVHSITNLIPSTYLDSLNPTSFIKNLFLPLAKIEESIPLPLPGCSLVILAQKN